MAYGGGVSANSFGTNYNTGYFGAGGYVGLTMPGEYRLQFDLQGEGTGNYCTPCKDRSQSIFATHIDYRLDRNFNAGLFGGLQYAHPTFGAPSDTNYFIGGEARYNGSTWMAGLQGGYFDVANGPGTLTNAWFLEARGKLALGNLFGSSNYFNPVLNVNYGYASGNLSALPVGATTSQWGLGISQDIDSAAMTLFIGYHQFTNRVEGTGTVWNEHQIKGGVKFDLYPVASGLPTLERSLPVPYWLRAVTAF